MNTETAAPSVDDNTLQEMRALFDAQYRESRQQGAVTAEVRIDRLNRLHAGVAKYQDAIMDACVADFGNRSRHQTQMSEVLAVMANLKHASKNVKKWMKPQKRKPPFPFGVLGSTARVEYVPKGVVGVLATWNFPVFTALSPAACILGAGNRALIKVSELTPATGEVMTTIIKENFDATELATVAGGPEVGAEFAGLPFDHLIFTGGTHIGRHILNAAAPNLTPVTLELGGKSPVIVGRSADLQFAVERIMTGKALNQGQACLAPDYCFVPKESVNDFVKIATDYYSELFPTIIDNPDYSSIINQRHHDRITGIIDDARQKGATIHEINPANDDFSQQAEGLHRIPMTLVLDADEDMRVMQEELFGPVLAIKPYDRLDDCIAYINAHPRPLGLYYFGKDKTEEREVLDRTISGGVTLNDVMGHPSCEELPFGGIGHSGMGGYHGQDGFRTFSHARAIYKQTGINLMKLGGMLPPYSDQTTANLDKQTRS